MKHSMALKLLVAGVCAFGGAAMAQQGTGAQEGQSAPGASPGTMPSDTPSSDMPSSKSGSASDAAAPRRTMTREQKKQSLENIKKAVRDAASQGSQLSSGKTGAVEHLKVFRRGDKVILRGTVRSQEDKDRLGSAANDAAMGEPIVNELKVK